MAVSLVDSGAYAFVVTCRLAAEEQERRDRELAERLAQVSAGYHINCCLSRNCC